MFNHFILLAGKRRFQSISSNDYAERITPACPKNTLRKNQWAVRTFQKWKEEVINEASAEFKEVTDILENNDLMTMTGHELNLCVSVFVLSLKKEDGGEYKGNSK